MRRQARADAPLISPSLCPYLPFFSSPHLLFIPTFVSSQLFCSSLHNLASGSQERSSSSLPRSIEGLLWFFMPAILSCAGCGESVKSKTRRWRKNHESFNLFRCLQTEKLPFSVENDFMSLTQFWFVLQTLLRLWFSPVFQWLQLCCFQ